MSRRVTLVMLGAAGCLAIAGFLARAAASRGPARADDSLFSAALLGGAALVIGWLLGMPDAAMPSRTALRAVQTIAAVLSVLTIGIAGVGVVLAAWANRLRDYVLGQILIQSQVLPVLACLVTIWIGVSAQLRQSVPP